MVHLPTVCRRVQEYAVLLGVVGNTPGLRRVRLSVGMFVGFVGGRLFQEWALPIAEARSG